MLDWRVTLEFVRETLIRPLDIPAGGTSVYWRGARYIIYFDDNGVFRMVQV